MPNIVSEYDYFLLMSRSLTIPVVKSSLKSIKQRTLGLSAPVYPFPEVYKTIKSQFSIASTAAITIHQQLLIIKKFRSEMSYHRSFVTPPFRKYFSNCFSCGWLLFDRVKIDVSSAISGWVLCYILLLQC